MNLPGNRLKSCKTAPQVTYSPATVPEALAAQPVSNDTWSYFSLTFDGTCNSNFLTQYGQRGMLGMGTNHSAIYQTAPTASAGKR